MKCSGSILRQAYEATGEENVLMAVEAIEEEAHELAESGQLEDDDESHHTKKCKACKTRFWYVQFTVTAWYRF